MKPPRLLFRPRTTLSKDEFATLYDACMEVLRNEAAEVHGFTAEQDQIVLSRGLQSVTSSQTAISSAFFSFFGPSQPDFM